MSLKVSTPVGVQAGNQVGWAFAHLVFWSEDSFNGRKHCWVLHSAFRRRDLGYSVTRRLSNTEFFSALLWCTWQSASLDTSTNQTMTHFVIRKGLTFRESLGAFPFAPDPDSSEANLSHHHRVISTTRRWTSEPDAQLQTLLGFHHFSH